MQMSSITKHWKRLLGVVILLGGAVALTYYVKPIVSCKSVVEGPGQLIQASDSVRDKVVTLSDYVRYPGKNGQNALVLLEEIAPVGKQQFDFGVLVESIGGIEPPENQFWKLYINGQGSPVGADQLQTCRGDVVEWLIEDISDE